MIPAGYLAKRVESAPDWLDAPSVTDIYSVSGCISEDFADYINYWQHNGYWLFDSPNIIQAIAEQHDLRLSDCTLFYYEVYQRQFNDRSRSWEPFHPEPSFSLAVEPPRNPRLEGYDVVTFSGQTSPECSPLSCNGLAQSIATNIHCLVGSLEEARDLLEAGRFINCEPGPYRIFSVYTPTWP
jgi:hypothetical protein